MSRPLPDIPSDRILLQGYRHCRDMDAFKTLVERHQRDLLRTASALLGDGDAAQDAVQEAFLRLVRDADRLLAAKAPGDGRDSLGGWLCTVTRNHCFDLLRRRQSQRTTATAAPDAVADEAPPPAEPGPVWREVESLPPLERAAVVLRYRDGLSYRDIAAHLGKTATHVGVLLHQAIERLRQSPRLRAESLP